MRRLFTLEAPLFKLPLTYQNNAAAPEKLLSSRLSPSSGVGFASTEEVFVYLPADSEDFASKMFALYKIGK